MAGWTSIAGGRSLVLNRCCGVGGTVGSVRRGGGGGGGMGMGWDEMGRVRSPLVDWCRVDPSRVVCVRGSGCGCVCTREEDLVRLAQNRESRIAIDLGVWVWSCPVLPLPLQAGPEISPAPGAYVRMSGRVDKRDCQQGISNHESELLLFLFFFFFPFLTPWSFGFWPCLR